MEGWIKLHRKLLDNPIVCKDSDHLAVWIYLLLNATHKEIKANFEGRFILLKKGQLITGRKTISSRLNISESKVQRILTCFKSEQLIEQQTNPRNRLISIVKWDEYQQSEQQNEQQMNTNKNVKNNVYLFNNNIDFDIYDSDSNFQEYLKSKGIYSKQAFYNLSNSEQEKLSEKFVMGG